jgi:hypothetical protein
MNTNEIVASEPLSGSNINIGYDHITMLDGADPAVTQCTIRGSSIAFAQNAFPNRTLTIDPDTTTFVNGGFRTDISGGTITAATGSTQTATLVGSGFYSTVNNSGYTSEPNITLRNNNFNAGNTVGTPCMMSYRTGRLGAVGHVIYSEQYVAANYLNTNVTYGKIESRITGSSVGAGDDGAIDFYCCVNGNLQNVMTLNGADNENNTYRPLDLNGNALKTSSGNLTIETTGSSGPGIIQINSLQSASMNTNNGGALSLNTSGGGNIVMNTSAGIVFNGATIQSSTSGGNSGQHLIVTVNGTQYKIALQNM